MIALGAWGRRFLLVEPELAIHNQVLEDGGSDLQEASMDELRGAHLSLPATASGPSVAERLKRTFQRAKL